MEILVAVAVGSILIGGSATLMAVSLRNYRMVKQKLVANGLVHQEAEIIQALGRGNWHTIYDLDKDTDYYTTASSSTWVINSGQEVDTVGEVPYKRYFQISNVNRDGSGDIVDTGDDDPSTQKITVFLEYGDNYARSSSLLFYLTRSEDNHTFTQTDWSGGSGQTDPVPNPSNKYDSASNIDDSTAGQITMATTTSDGILTSSIFDTGVSGGAGFNSLLWQGTLVASSTVSFQLAFATSSTGTWTYYGPTSTSDWYQPNPNISVASPTTGSASPQNMRYIRYKVKLSTTGDTPVINDIIINWSP